MAAKPLKKYLFVAVLVALMISSLGCHWQHRHHHHHRYHGYSHHHR